MQNSDFSTFYITIEQYCEYVGGITKRQYFRQKAKNQIPFKEVKMQSQYGKTTFLVVPKDKIKFKKVTINKKDGTLTITDVSALND